MIHTEIDIGAPVERVWDVLTDFEAYRNWNTFMPRFSGTPTVGSVVRFRIAPPDSRAMDIKALVLAATPAQELRWRGGLPVPGLFSGEHGFHLEAAGAGRTHLVQEERFRGLLVPIFGAMLRKTERGFEAMNAALKARCESA